MREKENTSLSIPLPYWLAGFLLMAVIDGISLAVDRFQVSGNTLHDYDTLTRLAYLRQVLAQHDWKHGFFDRINAPYGMVLHWTLPFNLYMILLVKLFSLINPGAALHYAGYWAGTILRAFVGPVAYWAGRAVLEPGAAAIASLLVLFSPFLMVYAHHGSANHHALMYLESVAMLGFGFRIAKQPTQNIFLPVAAGAMAGLCLWTTFELVVVIAPFFAVLFYLWVMQGQEGSAPGRMRQLLLVTASFAVSVSFAVLVDPPYGGLSEKVLDHISMPFQTLASIPFLIALGVYLFKPQNEFMRGIYVLLMGLIMGAIWLAFYPFAIGGVQGAMDPYVAREWLTQIEEIMPILDGRKVAAFLGTSLIAIMLIFAWRAPRKNKEAVLAGLGLYYILGQLHFRFALYPAIVAPYFIAYAYERARRNNGEFAPGDARYAKPLAAGLIVILVALQISTTIVHYDLISPPVRDDVPDSVTCSPYLIKNAMNDAAFLGLGKADPIILNEVNNAASLLYWTGVRTVAGNYHRDSQGIKDDYLFFRDLGEAQAKEIVKKRGVDFVLLCGNGNNATYSYESVEREAKELSKPGDEFTPQETMYTRLSDGTPPPWLKLRDWPDDTDTDLMLYQVDKKKLEK